MSKLIRYLKFNSSFTIGVLMLLLVIVYIVYTQYMLKEHGAITIAKVEKFESAEQGINLYITIYFRGRKYESMVDAACFKCEGKYFYIKIIDQNPSEAPHLYDDKPVPTCILEKPLPFNGWNEIPKDPCK